jgi:hypothetical protein
MKKLNYFLLILGLIILSCNKPPEIPQEQDVIFQASLKTGTFKSSCDNPEGNYALVKIDDNVLQVDVFYLNGKIYTNTLKLAPGPHILKEFALVNNEGPTDVIVQAIPLAGNPYANFVSKPLPFEFQVAGFFKSEIPIELLCFKPTDYENFGFSWLSLEQITIQELCFFGDICVTDYASYAGSLYESQTNGLAHDMPAIFKIDVYRNDAFLISYNNTEWLGEGKALCVQYPDYANFTDTFKFVLKILVKDGTSFVYKEFYTWTTTDGNAIPNIGTDGVLDFVLGTCVPDADLILPPYGEPQPIVKNLCFIGDLCATDYAYYANSLYNNANGLSSVMPAIFKIGLKHNNVLLGTYNNESLVGTDSPLCISYTDYPNVVDNYAFELSVLVIDGTSFVYKPFYTWTLSDSGTLPNIGTNNIMEFVLGSCIPGDINLPPYTNPNPPTPPTTGCETAFAYGGTKASCFINDGFGNWGWTNGTYTASTASYTLSLIAAAGGCDINNGTVVGSVTLKYKTDGTVKVTYTLVSGFELDAVHLYIGALKYPLKKEETTVAPGQYTVINDALPSGTTSYVFNLTNIYGPIYMIAHADVCGNY